MINFLRRYNVQNLIYAQQTLKLLGHHVPSNYVATYFYRSASFSSSLQNTKYETQNCYWILTCCCSIVILSYVCVKYAEVTELQIHKWKSVGFNLRSFRRSSEISLLFFKIVFTNFKTVFLKLWAAVTQEAVKLKSGRSNMCILKNIFHVIGPLKC
jgi:hypothetical protein